ncbi:hypothetical protein ACHAPJ_009742, partial [Fusarium lateritium]
HDVLRRVSDDTSEGQFNSDRAYWEALSSKFKNNNWKFNEEYGYYQLRESYWGSNTEEAKKPKKPKKLEKPEVPEELPQRKRGSDKNDRKKEEERDKTRDEQSKGEYDCFADVRDKHGRKLTMDIVKDLRPGKDGWPTRAVAVIKGGSYSEYVEFWRETLEKAKQFSDDTYTTVSKFNVFNRFLGVLDTSPPIELILIPSPEGRTTTQLLEQAMGAAIARLGESKGVFKISDQAPDDAVELPSHPMGFYQTFASQQRLEQLMGAQKCDSWVRNFPEDMKPGQWKGLLEQPGRSFRNKKSQVKPCTTTSTTLIHGQVIPLTKRVQTKSIMGGSANEVGVEQSSTFRDIVE